MNQTDAVDLIADRCGVPASKARAALGDLLAKWGHELARGERVHLPGIGSLVVKPTPARTNIRHPMTGQALPDLPPGRKIKFSPAASMKMNLAREQIREPSNAP